MDSRFSLVILVVLVCSCELTAQSSTTDMPEDTTTESPSTTTVDKPVSTTSKAGVFTSTASMTGQQTTESSPDHNQTTTEHPLPVTSLPIIISSLHTWDSSDTGNGSATTPSSHVNETILSGNNMTSVGDFVTTPAVLDGKNSTATSEEIVESMTAPSTKSVTMETRDHTDSVPAPPSAPASLTVSPTRNPFGLNVEWSYPQDTTNLDYFIVTESSIGFSEMVQPNGGPYSAAITENLHPGIKYTVVVTSYGAGGQESDSKSSFTYPGVASGLNVTGQTEDSMTLTWTPPDGGVDEYRVIVKRDSMVEMNVTVTDPTPDNINGLTVSGAEYDIYMVTYTAGLTSEMSETIQARTLPPRPSSVECVSQETNQVLLRISSPTGDYEMDEYVVKYDMQNITKSNEDITVPDLTPGTTYDFMVYTISGGLLSTSAAETTCTTDLDIATNVMVDTTAETTLDISWVNPDGNYDYLKVECAGISLPAKSASVNVDDGANTTQCTDLTAGASYSVTVVSHLSDNSLTDPVSSAPKPAITVPQQVEYLVATSLSSSTILLSLAYETDPAIAQCSFYQIDYNTDSAVLKSMNASCTLTSVMLPDLVSDAQYIIDVTTVSEYNGQNASSEARSNQTWTVSEPVTIQTVEDVLARSLRVSWSPPDNNDNVCQYHLYVTDDTGDCVVFVKTEKSGGSSCYEDPVETCTDTQEGDFANTSHNIANLTPYTNYTVRIQAVNPGGFSDNATTDTTETLESTPGCVDLSDAAISSGFNAIEIDFSPPAEPNGRIIKYTVQYKPTDNSSSEKENTSTEDIVTLGNLEAFSQYTFTITASTNVGLGATCTESTSTTSTTIGAPFAPDNIQAIAESHESVKITWGLETDLPTSNVTYYNVTVTDTEKNTSQTVGVKGFLSRNTTVSGLRPFRHHTVDVVAYTYNEMGILLLTESKTPGTVKTGSYVSGPVSQFSAESLSTEKKCYEVRVTWSEPDTDDITGSIEGYVVNYTKVRDGDTRSRSFEYPFTSGEVEVDPNNEVYNFTIQVVNQGWFPGHYRIVDDVSSGHCEPVLPPDQGVSVIAAPQTCAQCNKENSFEVRVSAEFINAERNGHLTLRGLIVSRSTDEPEQQSETYRSIEVLNAEYPAWSAAVTGEGVMDYRATPDDWAPSSTRSGPPLITFIVGADLNCNRVPDNYCNGPLPDQSEFRVRAVTCTAGGCIVTKHTDHVFATAAPVPPPTSNTGLIAGLVVAILLLAVGGAVGFVVYRRRYASKQSESRTSRGTSHTTPGVGLSNNGSYANPALVVDEDISRPEPIPVQTFVDHVQKLHQDTDFMFSEEYELVRVMSPKHPQTAAELQQNRTKNRYSNILPYDHARVKLLPTDDDDPGSDYINASYMPGYNSKREFIAAQGPMKSTVDDFWRMIWEQNVTMVVMVTKCEERGKEKCAQYWPSDSEPVFYGDLQVMMKSESVLDTYTIRLLDVKLGESTRVIQQFHFLYWPDFGCPENTSLLLNFVKVVRSNIRPTLKGPVIVHCSAGVGRTGTFIAVDRLLHHITDHPTIDIFGTTLEMRNYRPSMIQAEAQYIFVHECLRDTILNANKPEEYPEPENIYQNVDNTAQL